MEYGINTDKLQQVADTYILKSNLITNREDWDDIKVTQTQPVRDRGSLQTDEGAAQPDATYATGPLFTRFCGEWRYATQTPLMPF